MSRDDQNPNAPDNEILYLVSFCILLLVFWFVFKDPFVVLLSKLRQAQLTLLAFLPGVDQSSQALSYVARNPKENTLLWWNTMMKSGWYLAFYPLTLVFLAYRVFKDKTNHFDTKHDIFSLSKQESELWREIKPVIGVDSLKGDTRKGGWAASPSALTFCSSNRLISGTETMRIGSQEMEIPLINYNRAKEVLSTQLGPIWTGYAQMSLECKIIFLILALNTIEKIGSDRSLEISRRVSASWNNKPFLKNEDPEDWKKAIAESMRTVDLSWMPEIEAEVFSNQDFARQLRHLEIIHGYTYTLLASLLLFTRKLTGVQSTAAFQWLKPVNRTLFYILNSLGRQETYHIEACGAMSHWQCEQQAQMAIFTPQLRPAIDYRGMVLNYKGEFIKDVHVGGLAFALREFKSENIEQKAFER